MLAFEFFEETVFGRHFGSKGSEAKIVGTHRNEVVHLVAAVDVQALSDGSKAVSWIKVSVALTIFTQTPHIGVCVLIEKVIFTEVVNIGTFSMNHFAEQSVTNHVKGE